MAMSHGARLVVNVDLSKYAFFHSHIENFVLLPNQGFCNENYSFRMDGKTYLLRKFKVQDVDRKFEFNIQNLAYQKGIAAEAIVLDEEVGLMIAQYLEGHHKEHLSQSDLTQIAELLQKLHDIEIDAEPLKLQEHFKTQSPQIQEAFQIILKYPVENVLCHNDLNPKNILFSDDIKLIDWEYAAINDRYYDLAAVSVEFKLTTQEESYLLQNYFISDERPSLKKLHAYKTIYAALCQQWFKEHGYK